MPDTTVSTNEVLSGQNQKILMSVDTRISVLDTKFDYMARDIKSLADGLIQRITVNETNILAVSVRTSAIEKILNEMRVSLRTTFIIGGGVCALLGALITILLNVFGLLKK